MTIDLLDEGMDGIMSAIPTAEDSVTNLNAIQDDPTPGPGPKPTRHIYGRGHDRWNIATFLTIAGIAIGLLAAFATFVRSDQNKEDRIKAVESDVHEMKVDVKDIGLSLSRIEGALSIPPGQ